MWGKWPLELNACPENVLAERDPPKKKEKKKKKKIPELEVETE